MAIRVTALSKRGAIRGSGKGCWVVGVLPQGLEAGKQSIGIFGLARVLRLLTNATPLTTFCVIAALVGLLFREQRQVAHERAEVYRRRPPCSST